MNGYFEIGIFNTKTAMNIGTLWRSAYQLGASGVFTIGKRYKREPSDTVNVMNKIPLRHYLTLEEFLQNRPQGAQLIGIEMGGIMLDEFCHPKNGIYILGAEDNGLSSSVIKECQSVVSIPSKRMQSYNVAVAGSLVMYDRCFVKRSKF